MEEVLFWILDRLNNIGLSSDAESLATGLLFGERSMLPPETVQDFRDAGMSHLLAVSGLHIALLWGLILMSLRVFLFIPHALGRDPLPLGNVLRIVTLIVLWLYVWMIGAPASAVRAAIMITLMQLSPFFLVDTWSWENLGIAAAMMLCYDPMQLGEVGFQLSFAATAGILAFHPLFTYRVDRYAKYRKKTWWEKLRPVRMLFWLSFSAQLFTMPLCAYYFHHLPLLGWVQGFLVVPVMALLVYAFLFLLLVPVAWGEWVLLGEPLYHWLSMPAELLSWWVLQVAHQVSRLEIWMVGGRVEFYPSLTECILLEVIIIVLTWAAFQLYAKQKEKDPSC